MLPNERSHNRQNARQAMLERRQQVSDLYCTGKTQWAIARLIGVSQKTVSLDLKAIREQWLASTLRSFDTKQAEELAKLDKLEAEAWLAWVRSCSPAETTHTETTLVREPVVSGRRLAPRRMVPVKENRRHVCKGQAGDPRFLDIIESCIATRLKVIGALKPDGTVVNNLNALVHYPELIEELKRVTTLENPIRARLRALEAEALEAEAARHTGNGVRPTALRELPGG